MPGKTVVLKLNQQQIELLDKTVPRAGMPDREALIRRALREYSARHVSARDAQKKASASGAKA
jgi:metal-responsive CopG/Arc/MetJ family transcriptional regulator